MLKIFPFVAGAVALVAVGVALASSAKTVYTYRSTLTAGSEVPKPKGAAGAKGAFTATVTESGSTRTISWKLSFSHLSGKAVGAHIHKGRPGVPGAVLVPLCGPCRSGQTGQVKISKNAADLLESGLAYVNVHTSRNAPGEIRGQVKLINHVVNQSPPQATDPTTTTPANGYGGAPPPGY